jgi:hypothetical protein
LQHGIDIGKKEKITVVVFRRDLRLKSFEDVQLGTLAESEK